MIYIEDIRLAIPWGILLSFTLGPVFFTLIETSILKGFKAACIFNIGVVLGDVFYFLIAYLGSYKLIENLKDNSALYIFGGFVMLVFGFISFFTNKKQRKRNLRKVDKDILKKNYLGLILKGFILNFINIGVFGFWLTVILLVAPQLQMDPVRIGFFFFCVIVIYVSIDLVKIVLSKQVQHKLTPKNIYKIKAVISIVLIVFGVVLLFQGLFPEEIKMLRSYCGL
ncbi:MAG: LysE family translocator [Fusobacteriaceae bacterium]